MDARWLAPGALLLLGMHAIFLAMGGRVGLSAAGLTVIVLSMAALTLSSLALLFAARTGLKSWLATSGLILLALALGGDLYVGIEATSHSAVAAAIIALGSVVVSIVLWLDPMEQLGSR